MNAFTLILPKRPEVNDEISIRAKLKSRPKLFILNLCVDSALTTTDDEPPMIAFQFKTKFKHHADDNSFVVLNCKKGDTLGWDEEIEMENTWIDDEVEEIDIAIRFTKREIHVLSDGSSCHYMFKHQYEIQRIDRLVLAGDIDHVNEVSLRYRNY